MTTPIISHHIDHPNAWKSTDFKSQDDFSIDLEPHHVDALEQALGQARKAGLSIDEITKDNFPLDDIQDLLDRPIFCFPTSTPRFLTPIEIGLSPTCYSLAPIFSSSLSTAMSSEPSTTSSSWTHVQVTIRNGPINRVIT